MALEEKYFSIGQVSRLGVTGMSHENVLCDRCELLKYRCDV